VAFDADICSDLAARFLALVEKQDLTAPLMVANRLMGNSLLQTGNIAEAKAHYDRALGLYDPVEDRALATRFGQDVRVATLCYRSFAWWLLGYPEAALRDADHAISDAREFGHSATLMYALAMTELTLVHCGKWAIAMAQTDEFMPLAEERGVLFWKASGMNTRGVLYAVSGKASNAIQMLTSGTTAYRSTGATSFMPWYVLHSAKAYAELGRFDDARRYLGEAVTGVETTNEKWCEGEVHRTAGELATMLPEPDAATAEACFERALAITRGQQAKSLELRAAMSMVRLWRDQGKRQQAHDLLAPVYGWLTEGFDTPDLKEAKALLEQLKA